MTRTTAQLASLTGHGEVEVAVKATPSFDGHSTVTVFGFPEGGYQPGDTLTVANDRLTGKAL